MYSGFMYHLLTVAEPCYFLKQWTGVAFLHSAKDYICVLITFFPLFFFFIGNDCSHSHTGFILFWGGCCLWHLIKDHLQHASPHTYVSVPTGPHNSSLHYFISPLATHPHNSLPHKSTTSSPHPTIVYHTTPPPHPSPHNKLPHHSTASSLTPQ